MLRTSLNPDSVEPDSLQVIDTTTGVLGEVFVLPTSDARGIITPSAYDAFDILIHTDEYLIGYSLDTGVQTPLLNWSETGVDTARSLSHAGILPDGRIVVLFTVFDDYGWDDEIVTFSKTDRLDQTERLDDNDKTVITLGGLDISDNIRKEVAAFNRENRSYHIQINDYDYNTDELYGRKWNLLLPDTGLLQMQQGLFKTVYRRI
jgi:hypothetical protein